MLKFCTLRGNHLKKNPKMTRDPEILLQAENQYPNEENKKKIRAKYAKLKKLFNFTFSASTRNGLGDRD